jgi:hypothetical protein
MHRRTAILLSFSLLAFGLPGCSDDGGPTSTPGFRVTLATQVELASPPTFQNAMGWEITLMKVVMSSGPLYYFDGAPIESATRSGELPAVHRFPQLPEIEPGWGILARSFVHAHPGHYDPGEAKGEMLEPASFDLIAGAADLPAGEGTSGVFRSARFTWQSPAQGALATELGSDVLRVEGTATKGDSLRVFRLVATSADALDAADEPVLEGCTFEEVDVQGDGLVTIRVDPRVWLDQADFADLSESSDGTPVEVPAELEAARAFVRGVKKSSAFTFRFANR